MVHIDDLPLLGNAHVVLGILSSCVICWPSYFTWTIFHFPSFMSFLVGFDNKVIQVGVNIMGLRSWESFQGPLMRRQVQLLISFSGIGLLFMENCAPSTFIGNWALVVPYLCARFHIFDRPILEEYVSQIEGGPHLLQSYLHATQYGLPPVVRVMHLSFESLTITRTLGLYASLMDIYHNISLMFILEDDSISSTFRAYICSCLGKGPGLWLFVKPSIHLFRIPHFTFTSTLCFCFSLNPPHLIFSHVSVE
jgi:hypothetical protein